MIPSVEQCKEGKTKKIGNLSASLLKTDHFFSPTCALYLTQATPPSSTANRPQLQQTLPAIKVGQHLMPKDSSSKVKLFPIHTV